MPGLEERDSLTLATRDVKALSDTVYHGGHSYIGRQSVIVLYFGHKCCSSTLTTSVRSQYPVGGCDI